MSKNAKNLSFATRRMNFRKALKKKKRKRMWSAVVIVERPSRAALMPVIVEAPVGAPLGHRVTGGVDHLKSGAHIGKVHTNARRRFIRLMLISCVA
jgi:hypothetical protein